MTSKPRRPYGEGKPKCDAQRPNQPEGTLCQRPAGWATDHPGVGRCKRHGGATRTQAVAAEKVVAERAAATLRMRLRRFDEFDGSEIDYRAEALRMIAFCKHRASEYGRLLADAYEAAERLKEAHEAGELLIAERDGEPEDEDPRRQTARADLERIFLTGGVTAFVGHKWDADRHGRIYAVEEGVRALVKLEREAIADLRSAIALAKDLKVAEAQIDLAKLVGGMIQAVILGVLRELGRRGLVAAQIEDATVLELIAQQMDVVAGRSALVAA
jgi:hypothetical protein